MNPKKGLKVLTAFVLSLFLSAISQANDLKVMTYNIRCGYCEDPSSVNHWNNRKYLVADVINKAGPDLIGFQEAEHFQIMDMVDLLKEYDWVGVGRDDGREGGEATAIFFRRTRFSVLGQKTLWLSQNPDTVSRGWDGKCNRTVTILKLKDNYSNGREFYYFNTHLDHIGEQARYEGLRLIVRLIDSYSEHLPIVLTGDFNFTRDYPAYNIISNRLIDAQFVSQSSPGGGNQTYNGFGSDMNSNNKIDYVFVSDSWTVLSHNILTQTYNGRYPSDHFPIEATLSFK